MNFLIMPKTKEQKAEQIQQLKSKLESNKVAILAEFTGLSMEDMTELRRKAREQNLSFQVVKNTLLTKAAEEAGIKDLNISKIARQIAISTSEDDEVAVSKLMYEFAKSKEDKFKIYLGVIEKKIVPIETIIQLAQLPSRDELLAKLVGSLNAPISGFVRVLNGPLQGFYNVVKALQESKS